ncbi:MAG: RHS repeat-associated core domain-containing protein, partial [Candidatus Omnitrophota bacterium]
MPKNLFFRIICLFIIFSYLFVIYSPEISYAFSHQAPASPVYPVTQNQIPKSFPKLTQTWSDSQAITNVLPSANQINFNFNLIGNSSSNSKGELYLDLTSTLGTKNLSDMAFSIKTSLPQGLFNASPSNGVQLFYKDTSWRCSYSNWNNLNSYQNPKEITFNPNQSPAYQDPGFDITQVKILGFKLATGTGSNFTLSGQGQILEAKIYPQNLLDQVNQKQSQLQQTQTTFNNLFQQYQSQREQILSQFQSISAPGTSAQGKTNYLFTGKELDAETGLYFYGARYYDAQLGRWISADPTIQHPYDPQDLNRYTYT